MSETKPSLSADALRRAAIWSQVILVFVAAVWVVTSSETNLEILPQLLVNAAITGSIYALASSGLSLTYSVLRVINFAHGHLMMAGAYCFYVLTVTHEFSFFPAALLTLLFSLALGWFCLRVFITPFLSLNFLLSIVTTITLANILEAAVSLICGVNVRSFAPGATAEGLEFGGVYITPIQIIIIVSALFLLSGLAYLIHSSAFGRRLRAVSENRFAAESLKMSLQRTSVVVFLLSTALAAYAGVMIGFETNMQPTMGNSYTIKAFAAMILGGLGSFWGTILGAYVLGLVENLAIGLDFWGYSIPAGYKDAFAYVIILVMLLFRPQGLLQKRKRVA